MPVAAFDDHAPARKQFIDARPSGSVVTMKLGIGTMRRFNGASCAGV